MIFRPQAAVIPYGIFLPQWDELFHHCPSKVTSDFMVDVLEDWWFGSSAASSPVQTLLLNQDNGPENHSGALSS
jgi:hypothetical protein